MSAPDNFILTESNYDSFVVGIDGQNEFKVWQGLKGPYYTPYVDEDGNLSWTNNGGLPNPATVNIKGVPGTGLEIKGIVESVRALPASAASGSVYLVGTEPPYDGYLYADGGWTYIGVVGVGENGRGIVSITKTSTVGLVDTYTIEYTDGVNPTTFTVTNGANGDPGVGVPTGGTAGQILAKASDTDYDTEWVNQSGGGGTPGTAIPLMDGTAAVGTSTAFAREDHRHPTDTSRASQADMTAAQSAISGKQDTLVSGTNVKTINGNSILGSGNIATGNAFTVTLASASWNSNTQTVSNALFLASGYSYIVSPAYASFAPYSEAQIYAEDVTTDGQMTFHCENAPSSDLTVNIARVVAS